MKTHQIKDAAGILGISPRTLERWVAQRVVPSYKIGGKRLVDVEEILKTHRVAAWHDRVAKALRRVS